MITVEHELLNIKEKVELSEAAKKAIRMQHKNEQQRMKKGWRWIKVGAQTRILVPCDKKGNPTEEGKRKIDRLKQNIFI